MRVVSVGPVVPFAAIPHAGGAYVHAHVEALLDSGTEVQLVVPDSDVNRQAAAGCAAEVLFVGRARGGAPDLRARLRPAMPPAGWAADVLRSPAVRDAVARADLIEYQWTQTAALHRRLSRAGSAPAVCVAHDVAHQLAERQSQRAGIGVAERQIRYWRARGVRADEGRILRSVDEVVTFSEKDAEIVRTGLGVGEVAVLAPNLEPDDPRWGQPRRPDEGSVLFVGAFGRAENEEAAVWLMESIWPAVRRKEPTAVLRLVGAGPTSPMFEVAARTPGVEITGFVEDLAPFYERASVAVVPLRQGAGVKFKTISAMFWGVPVVATSIGVEGVDKETSAVFATVADEAEGLAAGIVDVLRGNTAAGPIGRAFATRRFGRERFSQQLHELYETVARRDRPRRTSGEVATAETGR